MPKIFNALSDTALLDSLMKSGVGVLPTDTVYGLVCRAVDKSAATRLYKLKNRDKKPGTILAANIEQLVDLGIKKRYLNAVMHYWPNPISIVIPSQELAYLHLGIGGLAIRIPAQQQVQNLLMKTGPLLTSSANAPGCEPAMNVSDAQSYFGDKVDFYVDGGDLSDRKSSTIIRIVDDSVEVLREGAVTIDEVSGRIL